MINCVPTAIIMRNELLISGLSCEDVKRNEDLVSEYTSKSIFGGFKVGSLELGTRSFSTVSVHNISISFSAQTWLG